MMIFAYRHHLPEIELCHLCKPSAADLFRVLDLHQEDVKSVDKMRSSFSEIAREALAQCPEDSIALVLVDRVIPVLEILVERDDVIDPFHWKDLLLLHAIIEAMLMDHCFISSHGRLKIFR